MKKLLVALSILLASVGWVQAGSSTITTKDASGNTQVFVVTNNGSGNFLANNVLCDYGTGANCASVTSSHELLVTGNVTNLGAFAEQAAQTGIWNIGTLSSITNPVAVTQSGSWN